MSSPIPASAPQPPPGCAEGRRPELSRRGLLTALGGSALGGTALLTGVLGDAQLAFGAPDPGGAHNVLVTVVLSGGLDGLSVLAPIGDPDYAPSRPTIAIPESSAIQVDARFGLHPGLAPLYPLWSAGALGAVHAVGQPSTSRSHVEAMTALERAAPDSTVRTGWLDRALAALPTGEPLAGAAMGRAELPGSLHGPRPALAAARLDDVSLAADLTTTPLALWQRAMAQLHAGARPEVAAPMRDALAAVDRLRVAVPAGTAAIGGPLYPAGGFGQGLRDVARLVKAPSGLRVASVQLGGWDLHANHGTVDTGLFAPTLKTLADGLAAFAQDLGSALNRVTVVTVTEFGRRVRQNANHGVDHGHGSVMLLLGGGVDGGKVHGTWPGLSAGDLDRGQDLKGTTDVRAVLTEVLTRRLGLASVADVFPGYRPEPVGVIKG